MVWLNNPQDSTGTPCDARAGIVRAPHGNLQFFHILWDPCGLVCDPQGCRTGPLWTRKGIYTTRIGKNPARASYMAVRTPYGLFTGCLWSLNPYGARNLIMHASKPYGPRTGRQNSYAARAGPVSGRTIFVQNSPGTARTGPGSVMWLTQALVMSTRVTRFQFHFSRKTIKVIFSRGLQYDIIRLYAHGTETKIGVTKSKIFIIPHKNVLATRRSERKSTIRMREWTIKECLLYIFPPPPNSLICNMQALPHTDLCSTTGHTLYGMSAVLDCYTLPAGWHEDCQWGMLIWHKASDWLASHFGGSLVSGVGLNISWDCLSRRGLWAPVTGGNFHCFQRPLTVPSHNPITPGKYLPLGLCEEIVKESTIVHSHSFGSCYGHYWHCARPMS